MRLLYSAHILYDFMRSLQVHQAQRQEGGSHLYGFAGVPPGAVPGADGERARAQSRLRVPPDLRALSGALQDAVQADVASLEGSCQVRPQRNATHYSHVFQTLVFVLSGVLPCGVSTIDVTRCVWHSKVPLLSLLKHKTWLVNQYVSVSAIHTERAGCFVFLYRHVVA